MQFFKELFKFSGIKKMLLTCIEDEGVTESVVAIVTTVDQKLGVRQHGTAMPTATANTFFYYFVSTFIKPFNKTNCISRTNAV